MNDFLKQIIDAIFAQLESLAAGHPVLLFAIKMVHNFANQVIDKLLANVATMPSPA